MGVQVQLNMRNTRKDLPAMLPSQTLTLLAGSDSVATKNESFASKNLPSEVLDIARILARIAVEEFFKERGKQGCS